MNTELVKGSGWALGILGQLQESVVGILAGKQCMVNNRKAQRTGPWGWLAVMTVTVLKVWLPSGDRGGRASIHLNELFVLTGAGLEHFLSPLPFFSVCLVPALSCPEVSIHPPLHAKVKEQQLRTTATNTVIQLIPNCTVWVGIFPSKNHKEEYIVTGCFCPSFTFSTQSSNQAMSGIALSVLYLLSWMELPITWL